MTQKSILHLFVIGLEFRFGLGELRFLRRHCVALLLLMLLVLLMLLFFLVFLLLLFLLLLAAVGVRVLNVTEREIDRRIRVSSDVTIHTDSNDVS